MIGIVIPTLNRPDFVVRQLQYYNQTDKEITVYIGDGSTSESRTVVAEFIDRLQGLQVVHLDCSGLNDRNTIYKLISSVKEPYCAYIGDDDYLIPSSLRRLAAFLAEHPDYRTAQGRGVLFSIKNDAVYGDITYCDDYWGAPASESELPCDRLKESGQRYFVSLFSLHRTEEFIEDWKPFADIPDRSFGELAPNFMSIVRGKSKFIDCLHLVRQAHKRRYFLPSAMDWLATPDWYPSYKIFEDEITSAILKSQGLSEATTRDCVKEVIQGYLASQFAKQNSRQAGKAEEAVQRLINILPKPVVKSVNYLRCCISQNRELTLLRLQQKSSPYHQAFSAVLGSLGGQYPA